MSITIDLSSPATCDKSQVYVERLQAGDLLSRNEYLECYRICEKVFELAESGSDKFDDKVISLVKLVRSNFTEASSIVTGFLTCGEKPELSSLLFLSVLSTNFLQHVNDSTNKSSMLTAEEVFDCYQDLMPSPESSGVDSFDTDAITDKLNEEYSKELEDYQNLDKIFPSLPQVNSSIEPRGDLNTSPIGGESSATPVKSPSIGAPIKVGMPPPPPRISSHQVVNPEPEPEDEDELTDIPDDDYANDYSDDEFSDPRLEENNIPPIGSVEKYATPNREPMRDELDEKNPYQDASNSFDQEMSAAPKPTNAPSIPVGNPIQEPVSTPNIPVGNQASSPVNDNNEAEPSEDEENSLHQDDVVEDDLGEDLDDNDIGNITQIAGEIKENGIEEVLENEHLRNSISSMFSPDDEEEELPDVPIDDYSDFDEESDDEPEGDGPLDQEDKPKFFDVLKEKFLQERGPWILGGLGFIIVILLLLWLIIGSGGSPAPVTPQYIPVETTTPGKPQVKEKEITPVNVANESEISSICSNPYNVLDKNLDHPFVCERLYNFDFVNVIFKFANQSVSKITIVTGDQTSSETAHGVDMWCSHFAATDFIFHFNATTRKTFSIDVSLNKSPKLPKVFDVTSKDNPNGITTDQIEVTIVGARLPSGCAVKPKGSLNGDEPSGNFALEKITFVHRDS